MSTHRFMPRRRVHASRFILALLLGVWLALPSLLPVVTLARAREQTPTPVASPSPSATPAMPNVLNKAGVALVRLVAIYGPAASRIKCTGLGILVGSEASKTPGRYTNWILTDRSLVRNGITSCGQADSGRLSLSEIQILANNEYTQATSASAAPLVLADLCAAAGASSPCQGQLPMLLPPSSIEQVSPLPYTLFSFESGAGQPFLSLASSADGPAGTPVNIGLTAATAPQGQPRSVYPSTQVGGQAQLVSINDYLTPDFVAPPPTTWPVPGSPNPIEGGTPQVNSRGQLVGMWVNNGKDGYRNLMLTDLQAALVQSGVFSATTAPVVSSPSACTDGTKVAACWNAGIDAFYKPDYPLAEQYLRKVSTLNPQFAAARSFAAQAHNKLPPPDNPGLAVNLPAQWLLIAVAIVLFLLLVIVVVLGVRMWRRRRGLATFEAEWHTARQQAELRQKSQKSSVPSSSPAPQGSQMAQAPQVPQAPCPNCRKLIRLSETICPYCRFPLSPSESGAHIRLAGAAPVPLAATPPPPVSAAAVPAPAPAMELPISEQPTRKMSPNGDLGVPATMSQPVAAYDVPTQEVEPTEKRVPGLLVGTRTDRGIKRQHKPNEDSLFAAQGARAFTAQAPQTQQYGLFVVADGMGGHANGQDASRLAIQTIIDFLLPKISTGDQLDDQSRLKLMEDGIQNANQAVHERNAQTRADMGTTMTAALVIGSTAYVANVGDSRTYLYREGQGLSKITHDHSVVASLVEAGIIQPDDIYTHPKRNQIYRSLGEKLVVEVDTFEVKLLPGDRLLLCSDGLWDMTRDPQIQAILGKTGVDLDQITQELIKAALDGGGEDNISVIVVQLVPMQKPTGDMGLRVLYKPDNVIVPDLATTEKKGNG